MVVNVRRATTGGAADLKCLHGLWLSSRGQSFIPTFYQKMDALGACQNMSRASFSVEWGPETPLLFPGWPVTNTDETKVRNLKYAAVYMIWYLCASVLAALNDFLKTREQHIKQTEITREKSYSFISSFTGGTVLTFTTITAFTAGFQDVFGW